MNPLSGSAAILCAGLLALVPLAPAGVAFINTGLGRSRSAAQSLLGALCLSATAAMVYFAFGYCFEGGGAGHAVNIGGAAWDWAGASAPFFLSLTWTGSPASYAAAFQLFAVALVALIPWGSGADRWSLGAACASTILLAGFVYPLFAHWVWAGGWLRTLGVAFHLGRGFIDPSGAATIQVVVACPRFPSFGFSAPAAASSSAAARLLSFRPITSPTSSSVPSLPSLAGSR